MACAVTSYEPLRDPRLERRERSHDYGRTHSCCALATGCSSTSCCDDTALGDFGIPSPTLNFESASPEPFSEFPCHSACAQPQVVQCNAADLVAPAAHIVSDLTSSSAALPDWAVGEHCPASPWWEGDLAEEVHRTLRERERTLPPIQFKSPQLEKRHFMVEFLIAVCEQLLLSIGTRFLAIHLMDHFMDKHIIMDYRLKLVALTSLWVAAKFEEKEEKVPTIDQLQHFACHGNSTSVSYTREEYGKMELYLLKFYDWSVSYSTAILFFDYYLSRGAGIDEAALVEIGSVTVGEVVRDPILRRVQLEQYSSFFMEAALKDYTFLQYIPSQVVAASICAARICVGVPMAWNSTLLETTQYSLEDIAPITDRMLRFLRDESFSQ